MKTILVFFFLLNLTPGICQDHQYKNLVFEGGGIRGIAYAGAVDELTAKGMMKNIEKVGGTSAGAIIALTVSLGYTSDEIEKIIFETDFQEFNDGKFFFIGGIRRMFKKFGWYKGKKVEKWLAKIIEAKAGNSEITFEELSRSGFKDLYVTGTNLTQQRLVIYSREQFPKMKIKDAVRISMSVPMYFEAVFMDSIGNVCKKQNKKKNLDVIVDGGILGNFPIQIFDSIICENGNSTRIPNIQTLGIRIDKEEQIKYDQNKQGLVPVEINNLPDYINAFYLVVLENLNRNQLTKEDWDRTISVSSAGIGPKVRQLSITQKDMLVESGRRGVVDYLTKRNGQ